ncbi:MAG: 30S ribosomal protein S2 [Candidatus Blackburnbacteria bacterium]|nr:30S ribosomal protein S2 [Candidatus Blackburnbacteria bacterium]
MDITLEELLEAGCHFGHQVRRWNPKMAQYIYGEREGVHIFDLAKTREGLLEAAEAVRKIAEAGGVILFVGTKRQVRDIIRDSAVRVGMPYVSERWLGGTLTNFEQIKRSTDSLARMKKEREAGEYQEYTKHERLLLDRKIAELERKFGGIAALAKLPDMLFIVDTHQEEKTVFEAQKMGVPIVGIVDTNGDPARIDYPIPANDDAVKSASLIVEFITKAIESGLKARKPEARSTKSETNSNV